MRVILIEPWSEYPFSKNEFNHNRIWPPLCLANCATLLEKEGFEVKIFDAHAHRIKPESISKYIANTDKIFITTSSLDRWQCPNLNIDSFLNTIQEIRKKNADFYVMGYHGTIATEYILAKTYAKAVIRHEPEEKVLKICQGIDLADIPGVSFKKNGEIISNQDGQMFDLNSIGIPAYHLLDLDKYFYELLGTRFMLFETSRGCSYRCNFCNKVMYGEGIRRKGIEKIIDEIECAIEKYKVRSGYFIDLNFLADPTTPIKLCEFLINKNYQFDWCCQTRPDSLNYDILKLMKEARCKVIHVGIESGSLAVQESINKNVPFYFCKEIIEFAKKIGIRIGCFYMFGFPCENADDRKKTIALAKELNTDFAFFRSFVDYKDFFNNNYFLQNKKYLLRAYLDYYLRPSYLLSFLRRTPVHALFSCSKLYFNLFKNLI